MTLALQLFAWNYSHRHYSSAIIRSAIIRPTIIYFLFAFHNLIVHKFIISVVGNGAQVYVVLSCLEVQIY